MLVDHTNPRRPDRPAVGRGQHGGIFTGLGLITDSSWALASGLAAGWIKGNASFARIQRRVSGCIFIGLGLATALVGSERRG